MEIWKDIEGYEGIYQISTEGRVKKSSGKFIYLREDRHGYNRVSFRINLTNRQFLVHRLVAIAFIENPENKPQVNHKNRIKTDNRVENLEWCTGKENMQHAFANGRKAVVRFGNNARFSILKESDIPTIRKMLKDGIKHRLIGERFGVSISTVASVKSGKNWKHVIDNQ